MPDIPVSVLITTKNEEKNIARCLDSVKGFAQIIVIDSHSADKTCEIAQEMGAQCVLFKWNGQYPKKRGWCLENLDIKHDWVFWLDADEELTTELIAEIKALFANKTAPPRQAGFFIRGRYIWQGKALKYGLQNNKIALFNRHKMHFPVINDLDIKGMGEIEGHYQPICVSGHKDAAIGQLRKPLLHHAYEDQPQWEERHKRYVNWENEMNKRELWPKDPVLWREIVKKHLRTSILRPYIVFFAPYILKLGFLDGKSGYDFAKSRMKYAKMIRER